MLREVMPSQAVPEDPLRTVNIMTYELGEIARGLVRAKVTSSEALRCSYVQSVRMGLADLLTQGYLLAEQMGWKRLELENDGVERFRQRMEELSKGEL